MEVWARIRDFFTSLDHDWLSKFLEHRIADKRALRLIRKWVSAGVIEDGEWTASEVGAPQGASASPLLANVYLHYVLDRWARQWRRRNARGDLIIVRFADDFVAGFEHHDDAQRFLADLRERFASFGLELHPDKTRLIEFGRHAAATRAARGDGKPETFDFLGFTHICGKSKTGRFWLKRITVSKRVRAKLAEVNLSLKQRRHLPVPEQGQWLASVVRGHLAYYAVPGNTDAVAAFRTQVTRHWSKALRRRSQRTRINWARMHRLETRWLPPGGGHRGVVETVEQVDRPRSRSGQAHPNLAGELGVAAGHERRHLLVTGLDEPQLLFMAAQRAEDAVDPVPREAIDRVDPPLDETLTQIVACGLSHDNVPPCSQRSCLLYALPTDSRVRAAWEASAINTLATPPTGTRKFH